MHLETMTNYPNRGHPCAVKDASMSKHSEADYVGERASQCVALLRLPASRKPLFDSA